jgi:hypothetical protein
MIEWFIIAVVSFANTERLEVKQMLEGFTTESACKQYIKHTPAIINDIQILEPTNVGISFMCATPAEIQRLKIKRRAI